ncbi:MAG TPA: hypothetical protein VGE64_05190 [Xanthomonadaceae bacterium]
MEVFVKVATSFPTVVYSVLLLVVTVHWLLSALGILELDALDGLLPDDIGVDGAHAAHGAHGAHGTHGSHGDHGSFGGFLMKFGLHGVPVMVVFTIIAIVGWLFCYFVDLHLLSRMQGGVLGALAATATIVGGLLLSIPVGRMVLAPVRRLLRRYEPVTQRPLLGRYAEVRSPEITQTHGTAWVDDGGAGLVLQVRADTPGRFVRGDRVVLIEYLDEQNAYRVTSTEEFEAI